MTDIKERIKAVLREVRTTDDARMAPDRRQAIKHLLAHASPTVIAQAEQELVAEGFTIKDLTSACDVHLELFREAAGETSFDLPADHPITRFENDHAVILDMLTELRNAIARARTADSPEGAELADVRRCVGVLLEAENHNVRQENTLFPMLERYGIEHPPAIMWQEHTDMRGDKKRMAELLDQSGDTAAMLDTLDRLAIFLTEKFAMHSQKERRILYPAAIELFTDEEWNDIREECDALGYFTDSLK